MKFSHPFMFYLVWGVIIAAAVLIYGHRRRTKILSGFLSPSVFSTMVPGYSLKRIYLKSLLLLLSLAFAVLSLTGPLVGFHWEKVEQRGVDIMIALDCSRSMLASDIKPTRLEQAKREIIDLLKMMHSDRAGLVAFAGTSILQCPLTLDHSAFNIFLKALDPDYLPMGGTDIGGAVLTALNGFEKDVDSEKAIIIITDGENTSGEPLDIAKKAAKEGVRIFCIGVGKEEGAPIPAPDGGFKKDDKGRIIMSRVDDEALQKIAAISNGIYVKSVAGDMDLDLIYTGEILKKMERKTIESGRKKVWENRFQWLLLPCVLFLILELLVSEQKRNIALLKFNKPGKETKKSFSSKSMVLSILLVLYFSFASAYCPDSCHAGASKSVREGIENFEAKKYDAAQKNFIDAQLERPEMPELYYNIGTAAYMNKDYEAALGNFTKALDTDNAPLKDKARFNLGNTAFRMGDLNEAVKAFEQIPEQSSLYKEARENLEFVKKKMEEQKENPPKDQEDGKNKDKNQEDPDKKDQDKKNQNQKDQKNKDKNKEEQKQKEQSRENQNKKDNQDKEKQDSGNKDTSSDQPESGDDKQDLKDQPKSDTSKQNSSSQDQEENQVPEGEKNKEKKQGGQKNEGYESSEEQALRHQAQQRLLNRLEDKPGSAMMPAYGGRPVEKDW